jgi:hypothetical protein
VGPPDTHCVQAHAVAWRRLGRHSYEAVTGITFAAGFCVQKEDGAVSLSGKVLGICFVAGWLLD